MAKVRKCSRVVNIGFFVLGLLNVAYYFALAWYCQSIMPRSWLFLLNGGIFLGRFLLYCPGRCLLPRPLLAIFRTIVILWFALFIGIEGYVLSGFFSKPDANLDYIIVLGTKVDGDEPSDALCRRIDKAAEYLNENPDTIAVVTGGKGSDSQLSEAECMRQGLVSRGIDDDRIVMEDKAKNTAENMAYSLEIIGEEGARIALCTSNFHMVRALLTAKNAGFTNVQALPASMTPFPLPYYMVDEGTKLVYIFLTNSYGMGG